MTKKLNKNFNIFSKTISFSDNSILPIVFGEHDEFLKIIENKLFVSIFPRGNFLKVSGEVNNVKVTCNLLQTLFENVKKNNFLDEGEVHGMINLFKETKNGSLDSKENIESLNFTAGKKLIKPRSKRQVEYFNLVRKKDLVFCCGPAGTGKTYLAVALAVSMLKSGQIEKIILTRPAVEAGEDLDSSQET